jgi:hypothetical protein
MNGGRVGWVYSTHGEIAHETKHAMSDLDIDLDEVSWADGDWNHLTHNSVQSQAVVKTVMSVEIP